MALPRGRRRFMIQLSHMVEANDRPALPGAAYRCVHEERARHNRLRERARRAETEPPVEG